MIGDLDYLATILQLPSHNASQCCALCKATLAGANSWSDFRATAPWRATQWTYESWRAWEGRSPNPLFTLPGVSALSVHLDWMHSKYLGIDQFTFGSVLTLLTCQMMPASEQTNLNSCWDFIVAYYREHKTKVRFSYLNRLTMFLRQSGCPKLRGKAAEIRHFVHPVLALWKHHMNGALLLHRQIRYMLEANAFLEDMLTEYEQEVALPAEQAALFQDACCTMLSLHGQIAKHFADEGLDLFNLTSKSHMVQHIALLARCVSPRQAAWAASFWVSPGTFSLLMSLSLAPTTGSSRTKKDKTDNSQKHHHLNKHLHKNKKVIVCGTKAFGLVVVSFFFVFFGTNISI